MVFIEIFLSLIYLNDLLGHHRQFRLQTLNLEDLDENDENETEKSKNTIFMDVSRIHRLNLDCSLSNKYFPVYTFKHEFNGINFNTSKNICRNYETELQLLTDFPNESESNNLYGKPSDEVSHKVISELKELRLISTTCLISNVSAVTEVDLKNFFDGNDAMSKKSILDNLVSDYTNMKFSGKVSFICMCFDECKPIFETSSEIVPEFIDQAPVEDEEIVHPDFIPVELEDQAPVEEEDIVIVYPDFIPVVEEFDIDDNANENIDDHHEGPDDEIFIVGEFPLPAELMNRWHILMSRLRELSESLDLIELDLISNSQNHSIVHLDVVYEVDEYSLQVQEFVDSAIELDGNSQDINISLLSMIEISGAVHSAVIYIRSCYLTLTDSVGHEVYNSVRDSFIGLVGIVREILVLNLPVTENISSLNSN